MRQQRSKERRRFRTKAHGDAQSNGRQTEGKNKRKGDGRNGAGDYTGARRIPVYLESMKAADRCPCGMGNLYDIDASPLIRIVGQAPIHADIYSLQKLRCNICGDIFTAEAPEGVGTEKYRSFRGRLFRDGTTGGG